MKGNCSALGRTSAKRGKRNRVWGHALEETGKFRDPVVSIEFHMPPVPLSCPQNQPDRSVPDLTQGMRGGMGNLLVFRQAGSALY